MALSISKMKTISILQFIALSLLLGCSDEKFDFYRTSSYGHDVWRLPIINGYELLSIQCCTGWVFQHRSFGDVDSLNLDKGNFLFRSGTDWYVFSMKNDSTIKFKNEKDFNSFIKKKELTRKLYSAEAVCRAWRKTGQLPWAEEILRTQEGL